MGKINQSYSFNFSSNVHQFNIDYVHNSYVVLMFEFQMKYLWNFRNLDYNIPSVFYQ